MRNLITSVIVALAMTAFAAEPTVMDVVAKQR